MSDTATFPDEAKLVLHLLKGDSESSQRPRELSIYTMVDMLGWGQTTVAQWVQQLEKSGWLESRIALDGNPAGGPCPVYQLKAGVSEKIPELPEDARRPWIPVRRST